MVQGKTTQSLSIETCQAKKILTFLLTKYLESVSALVLKWH